MLLVDGNSSFSYFFVSSSHGLHPSSDGLRPAAEEILQKTFCEAAADCYEPAINRARNAVKPMSSMEALMGGHFHRVPVLLGVTEHDGLGKCELEQTFLHDVRSRADFKELLQEEFGDKAEEVFSHYWSSLPDLSEAHAVHKSLSLLSNDLWYFAGTYCMAEMTALHGRNDVFLYCFAGSKRSSHGSDIRFWRGTGGSGSKRLSSIMARRAPFVAFCY